MLYDEAWMRLQRNSFLLQVVERNVTPLKIVNKMIELAPDFLMLMTNLSYEHPSTIAFDPCIVHHLSPVINGLVW